MNQLKDLEIDLRNKLTAWILYHKEEGHVGIREVASRIGVSHQCIYGFLFKGKGLKLTTLVPIKSFVEKNYKDFMPIDVSVSSKQS